MSGVYQTRQREAVLACLAAHRGRSLSVREIHSACKAGGAAVGVATIYRQLDCLVREGRAKKMTADDNRGLRFQHLEHAARRDAFYCKCECCGKITHADCALLEQVAAHMSREHGFRIDMARSVLYGRCGECE